MQVACKQAKVTPLAPFRPSSSLLFLWLVAFCDASEQHLGMMLPEQKSSKRFGGRKKSLVAVLCCGTA